MFRIWKLGLGFILARNIITALDIGTSTIQAVVAEKIKGEKNLHVLGMGIAPSRGVRRGLVVDPEETAAAVRKSVDEARRSAGVPIKSVWLGVGGAHINVTSSRGVVAVSRADGEISPEDVKRALGAAETFLPKNPNKEVLHIIPKEFKVDNEMGIKDPIGMHGVRLEVDALIVECMFPFLKNLLKTVESTGLKVENYVFSSLAASEAVLSKRQKELGVMLLDVGGGTASFIIYEEGVPIHAGVIPIGGEHITNDVAIGFKTSIEVAEAVKLAYGSCLLSDLPKRGSIRLAEFIEGENSIYTRKELAEIIGARLDDIFELLHKELKKADCVQLLPAGVVVVGGASLIPGFLELTKGKVQLPVQRGLPHDFMNFVDEKVAPSMVTVFGLLSWAQNLGYLDYGWNRSVVRLTDSPWFKWFKSFLP